MRRSVSAIQGYTIVKRCVKNTTIVQTDTVHLNQGSVQERIV